MQFEPQSEKQIDEEMMLPDGTYDFEVISAVDATSKRGNEMIELKLKVFAPNGSSREVRDWLLPSPALSKKKLARFCRSVGIADKYDAGTVSALDCMGQEGRVVIRREESTEYGMQLRVETYDPSQPRTAKPTPKAPPTPLAEDIPF